MAFADAVVEQGRSVAIIDRRHAPGGHWIDAYPFVRLHQASSFYGVTSTLLGDNLIQQTGPEAGLHERANAPEIVAYYAKVLDKLVSTDRARFFGATEYLGDGHFVSRVSGEEFTAAPATRVVNASYLAPEIPSLCPPSFACSEDARVFPVNDLVGLEVSAPEYVIVGSGKTATDTVVWLVSNGVDPSRLRWVRPREPWMFNRAVIQPNAAVFMKMAADTMEAAANSTDGNDLFMRLEDAGIMFRIDTTLTPTMAKAPTLAEWELGILRSVEDVIRLGHIVRVSRGRIDFDRGEIGIDPDAVVVHCAASGLQQPPLVPIWRPDVITLQPVRTGFPCFGASLIGHVEATRSDDGEKNRVCQPSPYPNAIRDWARSQVIGNRSSMAFTREPDLRQWANETPLNPARVSGDAASDPAVATAFDRFKQWAPQGMESLTRIAESG